MVSMAGTFQCLRYTYSMIGQCIQPWTGSSDIVLARCYEWMSLIIDKLDAGVIDFARWRLQSPRSESGDDLRQLSLGEPG
jgi:hypothetical protein